ncbi:hypothetical protein QVD17_16891 [Tagetes erecta]|uniref:Uncharacterized protein n=1 Tax=Tagetes erecta TaxID=13708 RepID=A0AAD8KSU9_TARER|nr:hypothetical protein QVD17_16891 [Tagetes erecta]
MEKSCSSNDPFVMPSQVKQVFYVPDPVVDGLHYVVKTIPRDIYDFDEENNETDGEFYWCEPDEDRLGSSAQASEQETRLSREDIPPLLVDASTKLDATNVFDSENGDDSDNDDTIWDWMHADEDDDNGFLQAQNVVTDLFEFFLSMMFLFPWIDFCSQIFQ